MGLNFIKTEFHSIFHHTLNNSPPHSRDFSRELGGVFIAFDSYHVVYYL